MQLSQDHIDDMIIQLLGGGIYDEDRQKLQQWIDASPENRSYFNKRQELWFSATTHEELSKYNAQTAFNIFWNRVRDYKERTEETEENRSRHNTWIYTIMRAAAMLLMIAGISYFAFRHGLTEANRQFADIVVTAPEGSRTQLTLPDGTAVILNGGSKMTYSQGFGISERKVKLDGEASFTVKHNDSLPFSIYTNDLNIQDLGTSFDVSDYADDDYACLRLKEGSVEVESNRSHETYTLKPNQQVTVDKQNGKMTLSNNMTRAHVDWTTGQLILNGDGLAHIARLLERAYGMKVTVSERAIASNYHFYGEFFIGRLNMRDILDALSATGKFSYTIRNKTIIIE